MKNLKCKNCGNSILLCARQPDGGYYVTHGYRSPATGIPIDIGRGCCKGTYQGQKAFLKSAQNPVVLVEKEQPA